MTSPKPGRLVFTRRPAPLPPRLRATHRVALLLEMVDKCRGGTATLLQLHAIDTALTDPYARRRLSGDLSAEATLSVVRVDPALNRAVDRAIGDGLLEMSRHAAVTLTDAGRGALAGVRSAGILKDEVAALSEIRGKITQKQARLAAGVPL